MLRADRAGWYAAALIAVALAGLVGLPAFSTPAAAQATFSISGRVDSNGLGTGTPVSDVTMTLSTQTGTVLATQMTNSDGQYSFTGIAAGGNYTVTPSKTGFVFNPTSRGYGNLSQNWTSQNFAATSNATATVQFSSPTYFAHESANFATITVTRSNSTGASSVKVSTANGTADRRRDYNTLVRTVRFADGESAKSVTVLLTDDVHVEGDETVMLSLSAPVNATLGTPFAATLTIHSDDGPGLPNPIDAAQNFVRQHYHDFLNREPDQGGLDFWVGQTTQCGAADLLVCRINVSAAFFLSIEFQETGYLVYRLYKAAYGDATSPNVPGTVPVVRFDEFLPDTLAIGEGVEVGVGDWQQRLENNKSALVLEFVGRPRFTTAFPGTMTPTQFVDKLNQNAGGVLDATERQAVINQLTANNTAAGRAAALRRVADDENLRNNEFNRAFVLMQYYGYLQRNPDDAPDTDFRGWKFWLDKLNDNNGNFVQAEMVRAFLESIEYRQRFGQ